MEIRAYLNLMHTVEKLKCTLRHSWTSTGRRESVAEHTWRLALMAYFIKDEFPEANAEKEAVNAWLKSLPAPYCAELTGLFAEMAAQETLEAKLYKALDKMEALIQHNEADIKTWIPLEYELNFTYGSEAVAFSEYLTQLCAQINLDCAEKITAAQAEPS